MGTHFVSESGLHGFLKALAGEAEVYGTVEAEERLSFEGLDEENAELVGVTTKLIEPVILIGMGVVVGIVAVSLFMPLFDVTAAV